MPPESFRSSPVGWRSAIPVAWVRQEAGWTLYSRLLNFVSCADEDEATGDTWLGTQIGIKRVKSDGTLRRIYTGADGLPGHVLRALAVEPSEAWCIVVPDHRRGRYALCRLDRATDRWDVLREVTPPPTNVYSSHEPEYPDFLAASSSRYLACVFGHVARRENGFAFCVLDREQGTWRDIPWELERRIPNTRFADFNRDCFPEPRWLHHDDESIFVGTAKGLGRYDLSAGTWDWFLTDAAVAGGAADGETLWLAVWKDTGARGSAPETRLHLVHLDPKSGDILAASPSPHTWPEAGFHGPRTRVITDQGSAWLVARHTAPGRRPGETDLPTIERFDSRSYTWQSWDAAASAGDLPPSVRRAAALACSGPPLDELREHLPGWFSPSANLPVVPEDVHRRPQPVRLADEAEAAVWTVAERSILVHQPQDGGPEQRFPLPDVILPLTPPVWSVAILNDVLYALTTDGLWRRDLPDGEWTLIPLSEKTPNHNSSNDRLLVAENCLWIGVGEALWRFEPSSGEFCEIDANPFKQNAMRLRLLDYDAGSVWLVDQVYGHYLYRMGPNEEQPQQAPVAIRSGAGIDGVCGGHIWYSTTGVQERQGYTEVIGYDLNAGDWTPPVRIEGRSSQVSLRAAEEGVYVAAGMPAEPGGRIGSMCRYDLRTGRWEDAAPPPPTLENVSRSGSDTPLRLVSVGPDAFWLVNPRATALWRWDRERQTWDEYSTGTTTSSSYPEWEGSVVRHGAHFFAASAHGLWQFDSGDKAWSRLPFPIPASHRLEVVPRLVDGHAVWALCYDTESRQTFAARFDKRERTWRLWDESDGFPVGQGPTQLVTDGSSAVVMTYSGGFFYLNAAVDRWREETAALSRAWAGQEGVRVYQPNLLGDPPDVWVQGQAQWDDDHKSLPPPRDPLAMRWNVSEGFIRMEPPDWAPPTDANIRLLGSDLLADDEAVWAMNLLGLWRWEKATHAWRFLALPASFPDRHVLTVRHMERSADSAIWLIGRDTLLRWAAPDGSES